MNDLHDNVAQLQSPDIHRPPSNDVSLQTFNDHFDRLAKEIKRLAAGSDIILLRNDGNFGDALIHAGTLAFLQDYSFHFAQYDMASRVDKLKALARGWRDRSGILGPPALFLYSGGGGWADVCDVARVNVRRQLRASRNLLVLPSTVESIGFDPPPRIFVRDHFQSHAAVPDAPFCDDMAFYLALVPPDRLLADRVAPSERIGLVFRTDNEARIAGVAGHPANHDISAAGTSGSDVSGFLRHLDRFEHIVTDRLHAAIGGALLGKTVSLVRGSYFKLEAIFRSSIAGNFPRCRMIDDDEAVRLAGQVP